MKRAVLVAMLLLAWVGSVQARGIVIPVEKSIPPLAMLNHRVSVTLEDQVANTTVEQTFRNHTSRALEAMYVFPVPKGASVRKFSMWVGGKEVSGELIEAAKAREIYTSIVRRTEDPGLLEYMGADLLRLQVFPIPANGDQKIKLEYMSIAKRDHEVVEYTYPLKTDGKATSTLEEFAFKATLKSQKPILNIYSPTHAVAIHRVNDKEAVVNFEKNQSMLDKDFQLFYTTSLGDVGMTALLHRPIEAEDGYFLLLMSPRAELSRDQQVPRDMVFVLDTSGSMLQDGKIDQAKRALKHCIDGLSSHDRFAVINFATVVNRYRDGLIAVDKDTLQHAKKWVDNLQATGGTAINDALQSALELQTKEEGRTFTVVFFTDGKPTIGETNPDKILANVTKKNTASTRIFTFGVGNDLNAALLDQISGQSRAASTYVRPDEDLEVKVSSFYGKISHPVLANLKIASSKDVSLLEVYPPHLPDLFHGDQLIVLGRYHGTGKATLTLTGTVGKTPREFAYETDFLSKTDGKPFVEDLWARRKVGYVLEQIRINGEKKELVDEVTALSKKYGIATPYTSYLVVPDAPVPVAGRGAGNPEPHANARPGGFGGGFGGIPGGLTPPAPGMPARKVEEFAKDLKKRPGDDLGGKRGELEDRRFRDLPAGAEKAEGAGKAISEAKEQKQTLELARRSVAAGDLRKLHTDKLGVDLSVQMANLKTQSRVQQTAVRRVSNRNVLEVGGVWIDEGFQDKTPVLTVKAMSDAYFRILEKHPEVKEVFQLGNHLVWITPSGTALVIDTNDGKEQLKDEEIAKLFVAARR